MLMKDTANPAEKNTAVGRFAPTPSGRMHLGNVFTALMAYASAHSKGGRCLLRIEDLDRERCPADGVKWLLDDLDYFGLRFDGETLYQSERDEYYARELNKLAEMGLIYPCYCSRAELHASLAPHGSAPVYDGRCRALPPDKRPASPAALRVIVPDDTVSFVDGIAGPYSQNLASECGDFIVRRSDGKFAYQLAVVVDDAASGVSEVVRGWDLLPSSPRQIYLYCTLGYRPPRYFHLPLLVDADGRRLSKRDGDGNLAALRARFPRPEPIIGALACAAGLIPRPEPLSADDLVTVYDPARLPKAEIRFSPALLR